MDKSVRVPNEGQSDIFEQTLRFDESKMGISCRQTGFCDPDNKIWTCFKSRTKSSLII